MRRVEDLNEIGAVWRGEVGRAIKSGRVLVLLILFLLFVGLALTAVGFIEHKMIGSIKDQMNGAGMTATEAAEKLSQGKEQFLSMFITDDAAMLKSLAELPLVLLVVFKITLRFVPLLIALMGFDQLAGEIGPKSIRFFVVRVRRSSLVLGKFLAQATLFSLLSIISTLMMAGVAKALNTDFAFGELAIWSVKLLVSSLVLALAYLAVTSLCSAVVKQAPVSLVLNIIVLFVVWFVALIGESFRFPGEAAQGAVSQIITSESPLAYVRYLSVWHFGQNLLHPHLREFLTAVLMHLGFAASFLGLTELIISKRDL